LDESAASPAEEGRFIGVPFLLCSTVFLHLDVQQHAGCFGPQFVAPPNLFAPRNPSQPLPALLRSGGLFTIFVATACLPPGISGQHLALCSNGGPNEFSCSRKPRIYSSCRIFRCANRFPPRDWFRWIRNTGRFALRASRMLAVQPTTTESGSPAASNAPAARVGRSGSGPPAWQEHAITGEARKLSGAINECTNHPERMPVRGRLESAAPPTAKTSQPPYACPGF